MSAIDEKALEAAAIALIDHDPSISGHHPIHIDYKRPIARAAITAYLSAMPQRELLADALEALLPFAAQTRASGPTEERNIRRARAAADKIRAALTQEKSP